MLQQPQTPYATKKRAKRRHLSQNPEKAREKSKITNVKIAVSGQHKGCSDLSPKKNRLLIFISSDAVVKINESLLEFVNKCVFHSQQQSLTEN